MSEQKKTAIVSGGGTGIGQAVCKRLATDGFNVVVAYSRSSTGAEETLKSIQENGGTAAICQANISEESAVANLFVFAKEQFGAVDAVINNAGIGSMAMFSEISTEDYNRVFDINTRGTFFMCREAARTIRNGGRIVNVSTGLTVSSNFAMALYAGSKAAIEGFTKTLAHELGPRGITANTVSPGMTDTPMLEGGDTDALKKYGADKAVMKRLGQPEDVADVIAALVSNDGRWITGQNIHADGGSIIV